MNRKWIKDVKIECRGEDGGMNVTLYVEHPKSWRWSSPKGYRGWDRLAACMRKTARRVYRDWRNEDE